MVQVVRKALKTKKKNCIVDMSVRQSVNLLTFVSREVTSSFHFISPTPFAPLVSPSSLVLPLLVSLFYPPSISSPPSFLPFETGFLHPTNAINHAPVSMATQTPVQFQMTAWICYLDIISSLFSLLFMVSNSAK